MWPAHMVYLSLQSDAMKGVEFQWHKFFVSDRDNNRVLMNTIATCSTTTWLILIFSSLQVCTKNPWLFQPYYKLCTNMVMLWLYFMRSAACNTNKLEQFSSSKYRKS